MYAKSKGTTFVRALALEQAMGIEPTSKAWEAFILPMNYACKAFILYHLIGEIAS